MASSSRFFRRTNWVRIWFILTYANPHLRPGGLSTRRAPL